MKVSCLTIFHRCPSLYQAVHEHGCITDRAKRYIHIDATLLIVTWLFDSQTAESQRQMGLLVGQLRQKTHFH